MRTHSDNKLLVAQRRTDIAEASAKVFVKKGYSRTNMREVAKACKMSIGGIYRYVGSKEDILQLVLTSSMSDVLERLEPYHNRLGSVSAKELLQETMRAYYERIDRIQDLTLLVYQETKILDAKARQTVYQFEERTLAIFEDLLRSGVETMEFKPHDCRLEASNIVILGQAWAFRRWFLKKNYTLTTYIALQTKSLLQRIGADTGTEAAHTQERS